MRYVLNLAYLALLAALAPWWIHAMIFRGKYREGHAEKLLGRVPRRSGRRKCIWMHAVSVGEVNLLQPVVDQLPAAFPGWDCCISTTTKTGYDLARKKFVGHSVFYCPLDFSWAVAAAIRRIRPDVVLLAELELWPNLIAAARRHGARVAIVNGRLSEHSARGYGRIRWLAKRVLSGLDLVAVQNEEYARRFIQLGAAPEAVFVTGSIKFDGAETDRANPKTVALAKLAGFGGRDIVFLAGSTQHPEESLALQAFSRLRSQHPELRLVLIPRHPSRFDEVARLLDRAGIPWQRRSELLAPEATRQDAAGPRPLEKRILLVDTVGELAAWWGAARIAFVGGSMGSRGGQNMIEPAAYGAAVAFGPRTRNFKDVVDMLRAVDAAEIVHDGEQLEAFVRRCLTDPDWATQRGTRAQQLVLGQLGATARTLARLAEVVRDPQDEQEGALRAEQKGGDSHAADRPAAGGPAGTEAEGRGLPGNASRASRQRQIGRYRRNKSA